MGKVIVKIMKVVLPVFIGAIGGYLYYEYIGCNSGCTITGNPLTSTIYGATIGAVIINWRDLVNLFRNSEDNDFK